MEYRLGFGAACSSGIAQRWVQMLVYDFQTELDAEEEPIFEAMLTDLPGDDPRVRWIRTRRTLSQRTGENECRLYSALVYTDDMHCSVVGIRRLVRALRCWRRAALHTHVRSRGRSSAVRLVLTRHQARGGDEQDNEQDEVVVVEKESARTQHVVARPESRGYSFGFGSFSAWRAYPETSLATCQI